MKNSLQTQEKGSILAIALILVTCFGILIAGLARFATSQVQSTAFHRNQIQARYTAEAGAKIVIGQVETLITNLATNGQTLADLNNQATGFVDNSRTFAYSYRYWPLASPNRVRVQVSATSGNLRNSVDVIADVYVDSTEVPNASLTVDVANSILNANANPKKNLYCGWPGYTSAFNGTLNGRTENTRALWTTRHKILTDPHTGLAMTDPHTGEALSMTYASPPNNVAAENSGNNESRILFDERFQDGQVDFSYRFAFQKSAASGGGGPSVFYGVQDQDSNGDGQFEQNASAKNFTSYEVAFNRNSGSFAVNKKIANRTQFTNVFNDSDPLLTKFLHRSSSLYNPSTRTYQPVNNYCPDFQSYIGTNSQFQNHGYAFQPNGTGLSTQSVTAAGLNFGSGNLTPKQYADSIAANFNIAVDKHAVDPLGNAIGRCSMSWEVLEAVLRTYYKRLKAEGRTVLADGITRIPDDPDNFKLSSENNGITLNVKTTQETMNVQQGDLELNCATGAVKWKKTRLMTNQTVMRQQIFIDGCEVLNFVDLNKYYNVTEVKNANTFTGYGSVFFDYDNSRAQINLTNSRSGFRIQNVTNTPTNPMEFYNLYSNATATVASTGRVVWIQ